MLELLLKDRKIVFLPLLMLYHLPKTGGRFIPKDNAIIFSTSYTKDEIDKYINWLIRNNRLLYLNEKKLHTQDNTGIYLPNATTLPLTGANTNNLHEYKKMSINCWLKVLFLLQLI